jgi:hypothetical protein
MIHCAGKTENRLIPDDPGLGCRHDRSEKNHAL